MIWLIIYVIGFVAIPIIASLLSKFFNDFLGLKYMYGFDAFLTMFVFTFLWPLGLGHAVILLIKHLKNKNLNNFPSC